MSQGSQKLSAVEKVGYSLGDSAANFVFLTMVLFQSNFYTDVMGIAAGTAALLLLVPRVWDAFFDPVMGVLADRTRTRWGRYRPWILGTAVPWGIVMYFAYRTPHGWSTGALVAYAMITNMLLMTLYSANNMPYAALSGVMTGDPDERSRLNAYRFVAVNVAQLIVAGFTLPLVAKFAAQYGEGETARATGWQITIGLWAVVCVVCFVITFLSTRERIVPDVKHRPSLSQGFGDLLKNKPWVVMFFMTLVHFSILSFRGRAFYDFYHTYANPQSMFDWLSSLGLTESQAEGSVLGKILGFVGYLAKDDLSNVGDVTQSIIGVFEKVLFIVMIILSPRLTSRFGKKAVAVTGFAGMVIVSSLWYLAPQQQIWFMVGLTALGALAYGPTIATLWSMFVDVADFSEWKTGRSATSLVFATICFALKAGLGLGSYLVLQLLKWHGLEAGTAPGPEVIHGIHLTASIYPSVLYLICTVLLLLYGIDKQLTLTMAKELEVRRSQATSEGA